MLTTALPYEVLGTAKYGEVSHHRSKVPPPVAVGGGLRGVHLASVQPRAHGVPVITLETIVGEPPSGRAQAVLLDGDDYVQRIVLQGRAVPWDEPRAYAHHIGQAQDLLGPDAALLS